jgi:hypothetical protein
LPVQPSKSPLSPYPEKLFTTLEKFISILLELTASDSDFITICAKAATGALFFGMVTEGKG